MPTVAARAWLGRRREEGPAPPGDGLSRAARRRAPCDAVERFVLREMERRGPLGRAETVAAVTRWIARRERSMGAGLDLCAWGDALWEPEAMRAVAHMLGRPFDATPPP